MKSLTDILPRRECIDVVIDSDAFNEIDDQFAIVWALLSRRRLRVRAIHAAPFENARVTSFGDGMERSYDEIQRLVGLLGPGVDPGEICRGAIHRRSESTTGSIESVSCLIELARNYDSENPLLVVAIGAITNVAAALAVDPDLADRIVVLWLGGHPTRDSHNHEFNLQGDPVAVREVIASRVRWVRFPCRGVAEALMTTLPEMESHLRGRGRIGDYLFRIFAEYEHEDLRAPAASKTIWDLAPFAALLNPAWVGLVSLRQPHLDEQLLWQENPAGKTALEAVRIHRDPVFRDLFAKVEGWAATRSES